MPEQTPTTAKDKAIADLTVSVAELTAKVQEQNQIVEQLTSLPGELACVTAVLPATDDEPERIIIDNATLLPMPDKLPKQLKAPKKQPRKIKRGDTLHITKSGGLMGPPQVGVVDIIEMPLQPALVLEIAEVLADGRAFIQVGQGIVPIHDLNGHKVEAGDRVLLGGDGPLDAIVIENLGKKEKRFEFNDEVNIGWDDIGGLTEAKLAMREAIEYPILHAKLYKAMGKRPIKGVLLEGPPGCGKTMLGKAAATAIARLHGAAAAATGYIYIKGPEVLSKWVGEAESTIRSLFTMAREHHKRHNYPAIIFVDECEALLSRRGSGISSDMEKTIVPSFLAEMDGLGDSGALVLLATNRPERLDPAIVRDGRVDRRVRVTRPKRADAISIFSIYLTRVPSLANSVKDMSNFAATELYSPDLTLATIDIGDDKDPMEFCLGHAVSGAMIAGIVDRATSVALHAAIASDTNKITLSNNHLLEAIKQMHREARNIDHGDDIRALAELNHATIRSYQRTAVA